jgi:DNA-binding NarL/FixJ family response regulator
LFSLRANNNFLEEVNVDNTPVALWITDNASDAAPKARVLMSEFCTLRVVNKFDHQLDTLIGSTDWYAVFIAIDHLSIDDLRLISRIHARHRRQRVTLITNRPSTDLSIWALQNGIRHMGMKGMGRQEAQQLAYAIRTGNGASDDTRDPTAAEPHELPLESRLQARQLSTQKLHAVKMRFDKQYQTASQGSRAPNCYGAPRAIFPGNSLPNSASTFHATRCAIA